MILLPKHVNNQIQTIGDACDKYGHAFALLSYREGEDTHTVVVYPFDDVTGEPFIARSQDMQRAAFKLTWPSLLADGATIENIEGWVYKTHLANQDFGELQKPNGFVVSYFTPHVVQVPKGSNIGSVIHRVKEVN